MMLIFWGSWNFYVSSLWYFHTVQCETVTSKFWHFLGNPVYLKVLCYKWLIFLQCTIKQQLIMQTVLCNNLDITVNVTHWVTFIHFLYNFSLEQQQQTFNIKIYEHAIKYSDDSRGIINIIMGIILV
jgi:hypothetical protein